MKSPKFWSRNGMWWRSMAEANFANYLYARGITIKKGERYPDDYGERFNRANSNIHTHLFKLYVFSAVLG